MSQFQTPILFIIFNRPDTTQKVFDEIKKVKPKYLYVTADGPRNNKANDAENCKKTRAITEQVDWECELKTLFREDNLGCRNAVSGGIDWFFENETEGIILEDDCLPHPDFFVFCEQMLEKYRNDTRVMHISGTNFFPNKNYGDASYYFSKHISVWGWATWRRAWNHNDVGMNSFPTFKKQQQLKNIMPLNSLAYRYDWILNRLYTQAEKASVWSFQWAYALFTQSGLAVTPNTNLISNIGFGSDATHVAKKTHPLADVPLQKIMPLTHPLFVIPQDKADIAFLKTATLPVWRRGLNKLFRIILRK